MSHFRLRGDNVTLPCIITNIAFFFFFFFCFVSYILWTASSVKVASSMHKNVRIHPGLCSSLIYSIVSNDSVGGWTGNALIRLRGCAGRSGPSLFYRPQDKFSHATAHITYLYMYILAVLLISSKC